jgi:flavin-dependent dehydrogenase
MLEKVKHWDAVIIGGGLSGGSVALELAEAGRSVLLLEKEATAHDKVCGEFISVEAQYYLGKLGLDLKQMGAAPIANMRITRGNQTVSAKLPFTALSLSRRLLDDRLLSRAEEKGAFVCRGTTATTLERESGFWRIKCRGTEDVVAETVFLATGKHDLRCWQRKGNVQKDFIGFKMHFRLRQSQMAMLAAHVELTLFDGGYAGLEPIEGGRANLCLVVTKKLFNDYGKSWRGLLAKIVDSSPLLGDRLIHAEPLWPQPLSIFGIPYGYVNRCRPDVKTNLYRIGDQMAVIPSFSGDGMSIALHTAALAAKYYLIGDAIAYHEHALNDLQSLMSRATLLSKLAGFPLAQYIFLLACQVRPKFLTALATQTRIKKIHKCKHISLNLTGK